MGVDGEILLGVFIHHNLLVGFEKDEPPDKAVKRSSARGMVYCSKGEAWFIVSL